MRCQAMLRPLNVSSYRKIHDAKTNRGLSSTLIYLFYWFDIFITFFSSVNIGETRWILQMSWVLSYISFIFHILYSVFLCSENILAFIDRYVYLQGSFTVCKSFQNHGPIRMVHLIQVGHWNCRNALNFMHFDSITA